MFTAPFALLALLTAPQLSPSTAGELGDEYVRRITPEVLVARAAMPAVIHIETEVVVQKGWSLFGGPVQERATSFGSGVVIYEDGFAVTNYHVVKGARELRVRFDAAADERVYPAQLVSSVPEEDLALIKIDAEGPFPTVPLGTSSDLMIAEPVLAIGNPYGQSMTVSRGIISGLHRDVEVEGLRFTNLIQTDASINPGNSGGPLLNMNGQLIGINTVVNRAAENMGFAIAVDRVEQVLQESLLSTSMAASWYGFEVAESETRVASVVPGSPAAIAELAVGDRVLGINGRAVESRDEFMRARLPLRPGQEVELTVDRAGSRRVVKLVGWNRIDATLFGRMGVLVEPKVIGIRQPRRLLRVTDVAEDGPAQALGLRVGDLIEAVAIMGTRRARAAVSPEDLVLFLHALPEGAELTLDVLRDINGNAYYEVDQGELLQGTLTLR
jgi:serine protease Do